jgi:hypothetical protein
MSTFRARLGYREGQDATDCQGRGDCQGRQGQWDLQEKTATKAILDLQERKASRVHEEKR